MIASLKQIQELANHIALQAGAISAEPHTDTHARARLMQDNIHTLVAWTKEKSDGIDTPDADDLWWAREDIGEKATEDEVYEVAQRRVNERKKN